MFENFKFAIEAFKFQNSYFANDIINTNINIQIAKRKNLQFFSNL